MNKTKIIATVGPSSESVEVLEKLILEGMDIVRINMTHADYDFCRDVKAKIDDLNKKLKTNVTLLIDTKGPELRVGKFIDGKATLTKDSHVLIYAEDIMGDNTKFNVNCLNVVTDLKFGDIISLYEGRINLQVVDKEEDYIVCKVLNDGVIEDNKSVSVKGVKLNMPFLSDEDKRDIKFAHEIGVDFLALSFVSSDEDILEVDDLLIELGNDHMSVIAKVETENAVNNLDAIIEVSDGVMVARGDLGVEIPMERIPGVQKNIINKCHMAGKYSIVATELLSSMENSVIPTRAEVSDIANAVMDGADSVMLSGETTTGKYPIETVQVLERIIKEAESEINYIEVTNNTMRNETTDVTSLISYSVAECASRLRCKAVITPTNSGDTAKKMSKFRPSCPIIAVSPNIDTVKNLTIYFGVHPVLIDELNSFDKISEIAKKVAVSELNLEEQDKIVITGGYPFKDIKHTNFMKIDEI